MKAFVLYSQKQPVGLITRAQGAEAAVRKAEKLGIVADEARPANENRADYETVVRSYTEVR